MFCFRDSRSMEKSKTTRYLLDGTVVSTSHSAMTINVVSEIVCMARVVSVTVCWVQARALVWLALPQHASHFSSRVGDEVSLTVYVVSVFTYFEVKLVSTSVDREPKQKSSRKVLHFSKTCV